MNTIQNKHLSLSVADKRQLSKESKTPLSWTDLDMRDRKIVMAVTYNDSVEKARKQLKLSQGGFYKRWQYLKPIFNCLLNDFPSEAINILKASSRKAAITLANNLDTSTSSDQIKAATAILDRALPKEDPDKGKRKELTITEWIQQDIDSK